MLDTDPGIATSSRRTNSASPGDLDPDRLGDPSPAIYRPEPGVRWAVEVDGILLLDGAGTVERLNYPDAALWDLLSRGYRHEKLVELMTYITSLDEAAVRGLVADRLEKWTARAVLRKEITDG